MDKEFKLFVFYSYMLPLLIMMVWTAWRIYSEAKSGNKYVSYYIRNCWPLLIPGVSLYGVALLLLFAMDELYDWVQTLNPNQRNCSNGVTKQDFIEEFKKHMKGE